MTFVSWLKKKKSKERKSKELGVFFSPGRFSQSQKLIQKLEKVKVHNRILG